jgi:hypothetical protein
MDLQVESKVMRLSSPDRGTDFLLALDKPKPRRGVRGFTRESSDRPMGGTCEGESIRVYNSDVG